MIGTKYIAAALLCLSFLLPPADANSLAIFRTTLGEMTVELYDDKPITVNNFVRIAEFNFYGNSFFHVCVPGQIVQGGGFRVVNSVSTNPVSDIFGVPSFGNITNEYAVNTIYSNTYGTIAMAKLSGMPDSASSQWFFNLGDNPAFNTNNGGFTVFGRILTGTNVLEQFNAKSNAFGIVNLGAPFQALPVTYDGSSHPNYDQLIYPGIDIFQIFLIREANDARRLLWNSPSGLTCRLQYQDVMNGPWNSFHLTNGNGFIQSTVDTNTASPFRLYRMRIE